MKKVIFAAATIITVLSSTVANAQSSSVLTYKKATTPVVEVNIDNLIVSTSYFIKDQAGNIVTKGAVAGNGKIQLKISNLKAGAYTFEILGTTQEFIVK